MTTLPSRVSALCCLVNPHAHLARLPVVPGVIGYGGHWTWDQRRTIGAIEGRAPLCIIRHEGHARDGDDAPEQVALEASAQGHLPRPPDGVQGHGIVRLLEAVDQGAA